MRWDRKLTLFAVLALAVCVAAAGLLLWGTNRRMVHAAERIEGAAEEGFERLTERIARADNVFRVNVNRRGKFEAQQRYRGFNPAWLKRMEFIPGEYLDEDVNYTHTVSFRLKSYDTENVYSHRDSPVAYTRYDDSASLAKSGAVYYVTYLEGNAAYHFMVSCPPLTEWLEGMGE
jgi:hypothetical protein